jgi:hypothetical protein
MADPWQIIGWVVLAGVALALAWVVARWALTVALRVLKMAVGAALPWAARRQVEASAAVPPVARAVYRQPRVVDGVLEDSRGLIVQHVGADGVRVRWYTATPWDCPGCVPLDGWAAYVRHHGLVKEVSRGE